MEISKPEIADDVPPYLTVYKDGTINRHYGTEIIPPSTHPLSPTLSKDILIQPETGLSARLYRPNLPADNKKLPLVIYFHGGAFIISSAFDPKYHNFLTNLVSQSKIILISVNYRLAPEHPLPAAFNDSWSALEWVASHASDTGAEPAEPWLSSVDFDKVYLGGDSAGSSISHNMAIRAGDPDCKLGLKIDGLIMIHPYFWGKDPIGTESSEGFPKGMVDKWVEFVFEKGLDDPLINPFVDGAPDVAGLECNRMIVCVAEKDILFERGMNYYERIRKSGWKGTVEIMESKGEGHVFFIIDPDCLSTVELINCLASFIHQH